MSTSSKLLTCAGLIGASLLHASTSFADDGLVVGADAEWVRAASDDGIPSDEGFGVHARLGYQSEALILYLRPEIGGSATFFDSIDEDVNWRAYGGARLGLALPISPAVFVHGGYGWYNRTVLGAEQDENGFTWDFGGALDLTLFDPLSVGAHISYTMNPDPIPNWLTVGGHVELIF